MGIIGRCWLAEEAEGDSGTFPPGSTAGIRLGLALPAEASVTPLAVSSQVHSTAQHSFNVGGVMEKQSWS